jgi:hypothetical protein
VIYDDVPVSEPLRQGDIFVGLPRVEVTLAEMVLYEENGETTTSPWQDIASLGREILAILPVRPVVAIVATQDCDAARSDDITLCEIRDFREVEGKAKATTAPKSWKNIITQHARINQKWFYLPPDSRLGFGDKMAVDFMVTLRVPRLELEISRNLRRGRLNDVAYQHFRERIGEFFRRYAYDEWYPLDSHEFEVYEKEYPGTRPFPWQHGSDGCSIRD